MKFLKKYLLDILVVIVFAVISPSPTSCQLTWTDESCSVMTLRQARDWDMRRNFTSNRLARRPLDQLGVWRNANLSDVAFVWQYQGARPGNLRLITCECQIKLWYVLVYLLASTSCCVLSISDNRWRHWVVSSGHLSSYFFIIIPAGHIWKVWALAYLPPMIAGVVLAYRGKYLKGLLLTAHLLRLSRSMPTTCR